MKTHIFLSYFNKYMLTNKKLTDFFTPKNALRTLPPIKRKIVKIIHTMYFDGGSRGNPGPGGAGYVIYENNEEIAIGAHPFGVCTNNEAEYHGVIQGLKKAISLGIENVNVYGDSLLVINQIQGNWKCKAKNLLKPLAEARNLVGKFKHITLVHVKREKNKRADELSNIAMDQQELSM